MLCLRTKSFPNELAFAGIFRKAEELILFPHPYSIVYLHKIGSGADGIMSEIKNLVNATLS